MRASSKDRTGNDLVEVGQRLQVLLARLTESPERVIYYRCRAYATLTQWRISLRM